ncbi:hypothetical protein ABF87_08965 [Nitrosomonas sp. JL21]|nr:hypothetical protein [Nitrosomonas sp. JL21]
MVLRIIRLFAPLCCAPKIIDKNKYLFIFIFCLMTIRVEIFTAQQNFASIIYIIVDKIHTSYLIIF